MVSFQSLKAQTPYPLYNNAPCDVTIVYEVWDASCDVCKWGQLTIPGSGGTVNLPVCTGWIEICIVIIDIGGDGAPLNHTSLGTCHVMTPYGQTGTTSTTATCPAYSWNAVQTGTDWTFN